MKDTTSPRDAGGPPPPSPKLTPGGRGRMDGSLATAEAKPPRPPADSQPPGRPAPSEAKRPATPDAAEARSSARHELAKQEKDTPISPEEKEKLRAATPNSTIREMVNDKPKSQMVDPIYGYKVKRLEADHIVPFNSVTEMKGFNRLNDDNRRAVLNYPPNFMGLGKSTNCSKGDKTWAEYTTHGRYGPVPEQKRAELIERERALRPKLRAQINSRLASQAG